MKISSAILAALLVAVVIVGTACAEIKTNAAPARITHADAKEAAKLVGKGEVTVLDICTPTEFAGGHIAGATNIDYRADNFATELAKLNREKTYLLHCATGRRSTSSVPQFEKLGFKRVIRLDGGIKAWQAVGNPVEKK